MSAFSFSSAADVSTIVGAFRARLARAAASSDASTSGATGAAASGVDAATFSSAVDEETSSVAAGVPIAAGPRVAAAGKGTSRSESSTRSSTGASATEVVATGDSAAAASRDATCAAGFRERRFAGAPGKGEPEEPSAVAAGGPSKSGETSASTTPVFEVEGQRRDDGLVARGRVDVRLALDARDRRALPLERARRRSTLRARPSRRRPSTRPRARRRGRRAARTR